MKVDTIKNNTPTFQGIYNSNILKKGLLFAAKNGMTFSAGVSLAFSTIARPIVILSTPNTDKKNKEYACAKSLSSSVINFLIMLGASIPIANAMENIDTNPQHYLKEATIKNLQGAEKALSHSKKYSFATQLFKLGVGFLIAAPKSFLTTSLIPPIMSKLFPNKNEQQKPSQNTSFTGQPRYNSLSKQIGRLIDTKPLQKFADKFHNSKYELHIASVTDATTTAAFAYSTKKNKKIDEGRKNTLIYNALISTGLSILGGYTLDKLLEKPTKKFIQKFTEANKNSEHLPKYIEGIKIAKAALLLGSIYYIVIPVISTFAADRIHPKKQSEA